MTVDISRGVNEPTFYEHNNIKTCQPSPIKPMSKSSERGAKLVLGV